MQWTLPSRFREGGLGDSWAAASNLLSTTSPWRLRSVTCTTATSRYFPKTASRSRYKRSECTTVSSTKINWLVIELPVNRYRIALGVPAFDDAKNL
ncbi:hypothetical protein MTO96_030928 [Rhipicephalus appendiculatus]